MLPTQPEYYCFLVVVFFVFWGLRQWRGAALATVIAANLLFLSRWGVWYVGLIPLCGAVDWMLARLISGADPKWVRRVLVGCSVAMNLGLIAGSRYAPSLNALLTLSLSFYAFQALTYTLEVYWEEAEPVGFAEYFASATFFPTVIAGPIARVPQLAKQWRSRATPISADEGGRALGLIALGLLKKFLIADYLANNLINRVFDLPKLYSPADSALAIYGYAFQLYYDFSGYSDIAIGAALLFGIRLPENFNEPYRAANLADFWRRWHISFSNWLRDNLYYSLPGKRTTWMPVAGLVITMALGGLWHGLSTTFLVWGLLHGLGLAVVRIRQSKAAAGGVGWVIATFHYVLLAWVFFRATSVGNALELLGRVSPASWMHGAAMPENASVTWIAVLVGAAAAHFVPMAWRARGLEWFAARPAYLQAAGLVVTVAVIRLTMGAGGAAPFIYSKF